MPNFVPVGSVISSPTPQPGQSNRSSGNFSLQEVPDGVQTLIWELTNNPNVSGISFNVMEDNSWGIDPTIFKDLHNASSSGVNRARSLYIANPNGAGTQDFTVTIYAVTG